jgi:hypothetical protein
VRPNQDTSLRNILEDPLGGHSIGVRLEVKLNPPKGVHERITEHKQQDETGNQATESSYQFHRALLSDDSMSLARVVFHLSGRKRDTVYHYKTKHYLLSTIAKAPVHPANQEVTF